MLVLSRKINQTIMIGDSIEIRVVDIKGDQVKIGINAPRQVSIFRKEVFEEIQKENIAAAGLNHDSVKNLKDILGKKVPNKKPNPFDKENK